MAKQVFIHTRLSRAYLALARLSCISMFSKTLAMRQHRMLHWIWNLDMCARARLRLGLPDLPYFTGASVFQVVSPASRLKLIRETLSSVFWLLWILLHDLAVLQIYQRKLTLHK